MATNFADAFLSARNNAQDRTRQREADAMQRQQFDLQMQGAQQKQQASQQEALYGLAKGYKDYLGKNPQGGAAYYENFLRPSLAGIGLGDSGPYNEAEAISLADQVLAAYGGQQTGSSVQSTYVDNEGNRVAVMRDGSRQILGQNAPNNQIIDTGDGFVGVNKGNLRASPVMVGGGQPQGLSPGTYQTPGGIVRVGDIAPEDQEAMLADIARNGQGGDLRLPQRDVSPQQYGQQLRSAPKPQQQTIPAGFRQTAQGDLEFIPGGPADPFVKNQLTGAQQAKIAQTKQKEQQLLNANEAGIDQTIALINSILGKKGDFYGVTGLGAAMSRIPGSDFADVAAALDTLRGRSAFGALQQMRANSPTGGALGSVTERELGLLQNSETQLQNTQSPEALVRGLENYRNTLMDTRRRMREGFDQFYQEQGSGQDEVARPTNDAEYNALPSGALFIDPDDGKQYRKP